MKLLPIFLFRQNGNTCFCGNQFGRYDTSDGCTVSCASDPSQYCGGYNKNAIYRNGGYLGSRQYNVPDHKIYVVLDILDRLLFGYR